MMFLIIRNITVRRGRQIGRSAAARALRNADRSIAGVSRPVCVFCRLGW